MAQRKEARLLTTMWDDPMVLALPSGAQRMYMYLLSQNDLSYCGVIPLRERRWAGDAKGLTIDQVIADLEPLAEPFPEGFPEGFPEEASRPLVVLDEKSGELLIRSLIRNDGIWKQPNFLKAARESATLIRSHKIKAALVEELRRIPVDESPSSQVKAIIKAFIGDLEKGLPPDPPNPSRNPSGKGSDDPSAEGSQGNRGIQQPVVKDFPCSPGTPAPLVPGDGDRGQSVRVSAREEPSNHEVSSRAQRREASRYLRDRYGDGLTDQVISAVFKVAHDRAQRAGKPVRSLKRYLESWAEGDLADVVGAAMDAEEARTAPQLAAVDSPTTSLRARREAVAACRLCDNNGMTHEDRPRRCDHQQPDRPLQPPIVTVVPDLPPERPPEIENLLAPIRAKARRKAQ